MHEFVYKSFNCPLPLGKKYVAVHLLTEDTLYFAIDCKTKACEVFADLIDYIGLNEPDLFGLSILSDEEYLYIDPSLKLSKYFPKAWKTHAGTGIADDGKPLAHLYLRVKFYVDCCLLISDKISRQHYYIQLKENLVRYNQLLREEKCFLLAAYCLQADLGNHNATRHKGKYFSPQDYFPFWILTRYSEDYIIRHLPQMHKDNSGMSRTDAQIAFIKEASDSVAPHNLHLYKMSQKKGGSTAWIGVCSRGVEVYDEHKKLLSTFLWPDIAKLYFDKKKFEIRSVGCPEQRKFTYFASSEDIAKNILWLCRLTHQFQMSIQHRVHELKRMELEGHKPYRESYIYSGSLDLGWEKPSLKKSPNHDDQRVSVISSSSSTTTSGIVSDKVQSLDESEDETDLKNASNSSNYGSLAYIKSSDYLCSTPTSSVLSTADSTASQTTIKPNVKYLSQGDLPSSTTFPVGRTKIGVSSLQKMHLSVYPSYLTHSEPSLGHSKDSGISNSGENLVRLGTLYQGSMSSSSSQTSPNNVCTNLDQIDTQSDNTISEKVNPLSDKELLRIRHYSRSLDIPLLSALCNDRTLIPPPRTVASCPRERHIGKDTRRYSCSDSAKFLSSRPLSWHLDLMKLEQLEIPQQPTIINSIPKTDYNIFPQYSPTERCVKDKILDRDFS